MARRFEEILKVKPRDNLGDPEYWNRRFEDIDRRISKNEQDLADVDVVADRVEGVALQRLDTVITPLVIETINRIRELANMFEATSITTEAVGFGPKSFTVSAGERNTFAAIDYVSVRPLNDNVNSMQGSVVSFDRDTGVLVVNVDQANGGGTFSDWKITVSSPPDLSHAGRTDDPHLSRAQALQEIRDGVELSRNTLQKISIILDQKADSSTLTAQMNALVGGASSARNTLKKLSDAVDALSVSLLNSPDLTGSPTAPTPDASSNNTRIATTQFVKSQVATVVNGAGAALDTLYELASAMGNDPNFATTVANTIGGKLDKTAGGDVAAWIGAANSVYVRGNGSTNVVFTTADGTKLTGQLLRDVDGRMRVILYNQATGAYLTEAYLHPNGTWTAPSIQATSSLSSPSVAAGILDINTDSHATIRLRSAGGVLRAVIYRNLDNGHLYFDNFTNEGQYNAGKSPSVGPEGLFHSPAGYPVWSTWNFDPNSKLSSDVATARNALTVYPSSAFMVGGGNEAELQNGWEDRLSVDVVATAPTIMVSGGVHFDKAGGGENYAYARMVCLNMTQGGTTVAITETAASYLRTAPAYGQATGRPTLAQQGLIVGHTYRFSLQLMVTQPNGPQYPRFMNISGMFA